MMFNLFKKLLAAVWYRPGSAHQILTGPMRGMWFKCSDNTGLAAIYSGNEKANQRVYAEVVRAGDTVIDAGANWGVHTLYLAKLVGANGHVHAFEPHPVVSEELRWHVQRNGLAQVTIHACGLFDSEGVIPFVLGENSKTSHIAGDGEAAPDARRVEVPCRTLDKVVEELGITSLRLIKIDIEGAEGGMLRGSAVTIQRFRPHIVVELHSPEQDLMVARTLTAWNYKLERVEGPELLYLDKPWPEKHGVWGTLHAVPA
jgi:FkbM family methyltransferase